MNRVRNTRLGRPSPLRALAVTAALIGMGVPAVAQVTPAAAATSAAEPARLTLENAVPLPVPPPPRLQTPKSVKAPPRFTAPQPIEPPPLPDLAARDPVAPPAGPAGAPPPAQSAARPAPAPAAPAPQAAPAAPPAQAPTRTAALPPPPPPAAAQPRGTLSVVFDGAATDVPESAEAAVNDLAQRMRANETLRLQLRSYAGGTPEMAREARQLSLARALALRERLTAFGIRSTRIDIRALGSGTDGGPPDRIDVELLN